MLRANLRAHGGEGAAIGSRGRGVSQNDTASDLKADIGDGLRLPWPPERQVADLAAQSGIDPAMACEDADQAAVWLVLADRFHAHGTTTPRSSPAPIR